ncbi:hypothetical protein [Candidatus Poriferisodalis sp.]|uniref:hypothetical protein n=1 Tax=Candidatus Poriferisodalis sp. TaxID=3101277 RepID=UPI003B0249CD
MLDNDQDVTDDDLAALEVIYRVMWEDEGSGLHKHVARSFRAWAQMQHPHLDVADVESDGGEGDHIAQENGTRVDLTRATRTNGGVTTTTLELAQHAALGRSVVRIRVLSGNGEAWVWVDVEAPPLASVPVSLGAVDPGVSAAAGSDSGQSRWAQLRSTGAESLVSELLDTAHRRGGRPHLGREPLTTSPVPVRDAEHAKAIRNAVLSPDRPVPYLVLAWDPINPNTALGDMTRRAQSAASQVAGLARVFVMPLETLTPFQRLIGGEMDLEPGEARLYLPGQHEPHRHRTLAKEVVRSDAHQAGRWASQLLSLAMVEREPPTLFSQSQAELGSQRRAPELASGSGLHERIEALESERDDLWEALFETREQRQAARDQRDEMSQQVLDMQDELELAQLRTEELQEKLIDKEDQMVEMLVRVGEAGTPMVTDAAGRKYPPVTSVSHALQLARANLVRVEIPPEIDQHVAELDNSIEARSWARSVFDGLLALEAYAHSGAEFGDFRDWCKSSKHPRKWFANSKKLAMRESEEVMRRPELRRLREMPVSARVSDAGHIVMEAHLKLSNGGLAPRLYFHDDTGRNTGKVHVGYVGPHLPTKRFRS